MRCPFLRLCAITIYILYGNSIDLRHVEVLSQLQTRRARAASLVALRLGSGRRHQLRSHCAHVGQPTWTDGALLENAGNL